jgi:hypothetical protein
VLAGLMVRQPVTRSGLVAHWQQHCCYCQMSIDSRRCRRLPVAPQPSFRRDSMRRAVLPMLNEIALPRISLSLPQPVRHAHFAVHRRRDGEMLLCLPEIARATIDLAETKVAVGHQRTHVQLLGPS